MIFDASTSFDQHLPVGRDTAEDQPEYSSAQNRAAIFSTDRVGHRFLLRGDTCCTQNCHQVRARDTRMGIILLL